ncbi:hypothetical protein BABINDRAFT_178132 [Babjeviella inositovora NRRL Y-12698]|uniref:Septin-type G domain-containing protein n=1 Tax=Babjeviella inositovora NRRL Y-12698 TaxID=984486 RepID=A0A1E3QIJ4_9ASCO|nr:uncharacterized protein BABINDRAFT_178132 [Babjeviella inositovora NRRL Y-12698]ODQ77533.1 hypothetical protein BABINDRAFT_178132 [Babjeviella inositovora NRRL Y-12698]
MSSTSFAQSSSALRKKKTLKKGIQFTLMIVGQSGSGRSTFINTLCGQEIIESSITVPSPDNADHVKELQLRHESVELEDNEGVKIQLNLIDTPGFGDSIDNEFQFPIILDYITHQYDEILLEESRVRRNPRFKDGRIHCLLYLITPTGHGLREIDITFMLKVCPLVNLIPVIAKADSLTPEELALNKKLIMDDLQQHGIDHYKFPYDAAHDDDEIISYNEYLYSRLPFAVIGSNDFKTLPDGNVLRIRKLPHGEINVEDDAISDFPILRNTLLITHLNDLKEGTHDVLYEKYRTEALSGKDYRPDHDDSGFSAPQFHADEVESMNDSILNREAYHAREEQIKLEEERLRKFEERVQIDLANKRKELMERERELKDIEDRLEREMQEKGKLHAQVKAEE